MTYADRDLVPSPRRLARALAGAGFCTAALLCASAQATMLTFESVSALGPTVNPSYGDRVSSFGPGLGPAGGPTPNIVLDFVPTGTVPLQFTVYSTGYHTLSNALGHTNFNQPGYIEFTPDPGWDVVLSSFDVAGWSVNAYPDSRIQIVDTAGTVYFDTGLFTFPARTVIAYTPEIRSTLPLRLLINDFGDLGLDNVVFSQVATIPEPGTWVLWLAGLAALGTLARQRSRSN